MAQDPKIDSKWWDMCGTFVGHLWDMCGTFVGHLWDICMCDICVTFVSKIDSKTVPQKSSKIDPRLIFWGLGGGPKNGTPSKTPKSEFLLLFTTLQQGPGSQKGTPFRYHFGDPFSQKNGKRGFQKRAKNRPPTGTPVSVQSVSSQCPGSVQEGSRKGTACMEEAVGGGITDAASGRRRAPS